ncbi:MAG: endonuclease/exonuclease/phosphatase family protein [Actinomycetota bacterium]|nr:endonuclease/exonuclease/phosphatase family protein [Actinomycetota bacterium]
MSTNGERGAGLVVATYNIHAGVDGWGRPFDVADRCRQLDADILVLQECWAPDDEEGIAEQVAAALGYEVAATAALARGRLAEPDPAPGAGWGPVRWGRDRGRLAEAIRLDDAGRRSARRVTRPAVRGRWQLAVLSRLPVTRSRIHPLPRAANDPAARAVVTVDVTVGGTAVTVSGVHLAHLRQRSLRQLRDLRRHLAPHRGGAAVLCGDMNLWGPAVEAALPGWRRAVVGPTWPAWRPRHQIDHVLVAGDVAPAGGGPVPVAGSDHLPLRAELLVGRAGGGPPGSTDGRSEPDRDRGER